MGMKFPTQLCGDYFINHKIRIPIDETNQYFMESKRFFFVAPVAFQLHS